MQTNRKGAWKAVLDKAVIENANFGKAIYKKGGSTQIQSDSVIQFFTRLVASDVLLIVHIVRRNYFEKRARA